MQDESDWKEMARQAGLEPAAGFRQGINSPSPATNSGIAE